MNKGLSGDDDISEYIRAAGDGRFDALFGERTDQWWDFVRERTTLGADELMIRIDVLDSEFGEWSLWLLFNVGERGATLTLEEILIPDYENVPVSALAIPRGKEQVPYFRVSP